MAKQYLFRVQVFNKKNFNPLSIASYYSGESQFDIHSNKTFESENTSKVVWNDLIIPNNQEEMYEHLPEYLKIKNKKSDIVSNARTILWQSVNLKEKRDDAQFARIFELTTPYFLTSQESASALKEFATNLVGDGMIVDAALHDLSQRQDKKISILEKLSFSEGGVVEKDRQIRDGVDNVGYLLCTLRRYELGKFKQKNRDWNNPFQLKSWRGQWCEILDTAINNSSASPQEKNLWKNKLSMYSEYKKIKNKM